MKLDSIYEFGVKMGNGGVEDFIVRIATEKFVTNGLDEVGFAKSGPTIEEKGIILGARCINDAFGGREGEVVVGANDEAV